MKSFVINFCKQTKLILFVEWVEIIGLFSGIVYTCEEAATNFSGYSSSCDRFKYLMDLVYTEEDRFVIDPDTYPGKVNDYKTLGDKNSVIHYPIINRKYHTCF